MGGDVARCGADREAFGGAGRSGPADRRDPAPSRARCTRVGCGVPSLAERGGETVSASLRAADLNVNYELSGPRDAPVVVLSHSLGTDLHLWDSQVESLARDLRILRY